MGDSFTNVFGGSTVQPSEVRYRLITLTGNVSLFWPQQGIDTASVIARWNDVNASANGLNITFPDATTIGTGEDTVFNNVAATTFNVLANDGTTIANVTPGMAIYIINSDNSTVAGSWRVVTFGAGSSQAQASSLAGAGLLAAAGVLNLNIPVQSVGVDHTTVAADRATVLNWTGGAGTITLTDPSTANFGNGWLAEIRNSGSGALTLTPSVGTIDGNSTKTINQTESAIVHTDGVNYFTVGYGRSVISTFTRLVISVAGSSDVALTSAQAQNQVLEFTGALTGNINVTVPANVAEYFVFNNTTGAHTLTFKTVSGTGVVLTQGNRQITHCDGTNIVLSNSAGTGTVTLVAAGTGLAGGNITSTGTLSIANTAVAPGAYTSANITIGADGRITAAANGAGGSVISITAGAGLTGGTITTTGTIALPTTGVTPGSYAAPTITIDAFGRITAASSGAGSFLPIAGGTITGNLHVNGTFGVTGATTLTALTTTTINSTQLQATSAQAALYLTATGHHQWKLFSNIDNAFYLEDLTGGFTAYTVDASNHMATYGNLTCGGNFNTNQINCTALFPSTINVAGASTLNGTVFCNAISCSTINTNGNTISCGAISNTGPSTLVGTVTCNAINCGTINTQGNAISIGGSTNTGNGSVSGTETVTNLQVNNVATVSSTLNASAGIQCAGNGITYTNFDSQRIGWRFNSGTNISLFVSGSNIGSWSFTPSDERIKTNIVPAKGTALDELLKVKLINFDMPDRADPSRPAKHYDYGFSAQQLETIIPEAVVESPMGGLDKISDLTLKSLETTPLIARCVGAIQQLEARIAVLEAQLASK